ncbi:hypothetical protein [Poseidonocella sp. HB161398]|uniref:hypothetical protein n=1 Tax=Poseidonocella sp. HB161398 TaxID=2320855 RepID=UPI0014866428|nr:hypothetical protein [Poseidonocella sp. HB161398]
MGTFQQNIQSVDDPASIRLALDVMRKMDALKDGDEEAAAYRIAELERDHARQSTMR